VTFNREITIFFTNNLIASNYLKEKTNKTLCGTEKIQIMQLLIGFPQSGWYNHHEEARSKTSNKHNFISYSIT